MRTLTPIKQSTPLTTDKATWNYNKIEIDLDKLKGIRVGVYDNAPTKPHGANDNSRYRIELQLWTDGDPTTQLKGDYKLVNKLQNWKHFRQNQYKKAEDTHAEWYKQKVGQVKDLIQEHHECTVIASPLGARQNNADGQCGYAHVPEFLAVYMTNGATQIVKLFMEDIEHDIELTNKSDCPEGNNGKAAQLHWERELY